MDDTDVITGGIEKLRQAVLYAEQEYRPDAIIIGNSCVPGIIGDDIDTLLNELDGQIAAKVVQSIVKGLKANMLRQVMILHIMVY